MIDVVIEMPNPYPGGLVRIVIPRDGPSFELYADCLRNDLLVLTPESAREQGVREF